MNIEYTPMKFKKEQLAKTFGCVRFVYNKVRIKIARLHEKILAARMDFLHKLSSQIINENQVIVSEDLNVSGMVKNNKLAKQVSDVS